MTLEAVVAAITALAAASQAWAKLWLALFDAADADQKKRLVELGVIRLERWQAAEDKFQEFFKGQS